MRVLVLVTLLCASCRVASIGEASPPSDAIQWTSASIRYRPGPPTLPPGSEIAVLEGNPHEPGLFTMRIRVPGGGRIAPHTHPRVRHTISRPSTGSADCARTCYRFAVHAIPSRIQAALERLRGALETRFGERLVELTLFGSYARGDARGESDVDVLIVIDELTPTEQREVFRMTYDVGIDGDDFVYVEPLAYSTEQARGLRTREKLLFRNIARDGVAL